jgi:hypothetical protein
MLTRILVSTLLAGFAGASHAAAFFSDNFDSNINGVGNNIAFNTTPAGWTIGNTGTVDVMGGVNCKGGVGGCVDLDGSSNKVGLLQRTFALVAGQNYILSFDLSGGLDTNSIAVNFGSASLSILNLAASTVFNSYSLQFKPASSGSYTLSFLNSGGTASDNRGAYLDNVSITVPEPGTLAIVALALGALALTRRKAR